MDVILLSTLFLAILLILYILGIPVPIAMIGTSLIIMLLPSGPEFNISVLGNQFFYSLNSFTLLAIPFYLFLGRIMNRAGLTQIIFEFASSLIGWARGGILYINILASLVFSGMSGLATADAAGLGRIEYTSMRERGYDKELSVGLTGSSAIIGPIIPPSVPIIIYGMLAKQSIGKLFLAGVLPGLLLAGVVTGFVFILVIKRGYEREQAFSPSQLMRSGIKAIPAMGVPIVIIGGILFGYTTATEAGAIAVVYACLLGVIFGDLNANALWNEFKYSSIETFSLVFILAAASIYGLVALQLEIPMMLADIILGISHNPLIVMLMISFLLLIIGTFLNVIPTIVIMTPILIPIVNQVGIDLIHFGIVMILSLMVGLLTPPLGMVLFVLEKVTDAEIEEIIRGVVPFYIPILLTLLIVIIWEDLSIYIPRILI